MHESRLKGEGCLVHWWERDCLLYPQLSARIKVAPYVTELDGFPWSTLKYNCRHVAYKCTVHIELLKKKKNEINQVHKWTHV